MCCVRAGVYASTAGEFEALHCVLVCNTRALSFGEAGVLQLLGNKAPGLAKLGIGRSERIGWGLPQGHETLLERHRRLVLTGICP